MPGTASHRTDVPAGHRQEWIVRELNKGARLTRQMVQERFDASAKTAKRDIAGLAKQRFVEYIRKGRYGYYGLQGTM